MKIASWLRKVLRTQVFLARICEKKRENRLLAKKSAQNKGFLSWKALKEVWNSTCWLRKAPKISSFLATLKKTSVIMYSHELLRVLLSLNHISSFLICFLIASNVLSLI